MGLFSNTTQAPQLTEQNLPDQSGKVFIVTGATSGVGRELTQILYARNARVYLAARSSNKAEATIFALQKKYPDSRGKMIFLKLDLNDLTTIKASVEEFLSKESKLDVLWNNAGVMVPPQGSKTRQGYELQLGTNCLAPFLFTKLLTPVLTKTAASSQKGLTRVVWVASSAAQRFSPESGVDMSNLDYKTDKSAWHKYGVSKAGNILHAKEYALQNKSNHIVSVSLDPGNLKTDLYRNIPWMMKPLLNLTLKEPIYGAYTELYAGLSPDVTMEKTGAWIEPWGQIKVHSRADIEQAMSRRESGGSGVGKRFWDWSENEVAAHI